MPILDFILSMAMANAGQVGDKNFTLSCKFTKYGNSGAATKLTRGWIPSNQTHRITGNEVIFDSYHTKLKGTVTKRNDERIEWTYQERAEDRKGRRFGAIRYYSYFFTTKKIASKMGFKIYRDFEYVWGTCDEKGKGQKLSKNSEKTSKASDRNKAGKNKRFFPIDIDDWRSIRLSSSSVLKYHKRHDAILFTSTNPWFGAVHGRLTSLPKADLRYAIYWVTDNVFELKGYNHFNYGKPDKIVALKHNGKPYIMIVDQDLDRIHDKRKTFMQISMRFDKSGGWFSNDTVLK